MMNEKELRFMDTCVKQYQSARQKLEAGEDAEEALGVLEDALKQITDALHNTTAPNKPSLRRAELVLQFLTEARFLAGSVSQAVGDYEKALHHFLGGMKEAPHIAGEQPMYVFACATCFAAMDETERSVKFLDKFESMATEEDYREIPSFRVMLPLLQGQNWVRLGDYTRGLYYMECVLEQEEEQHGRGPGPRAAAHYWSGIAHAGKGEHFSALQSFEAFEEMRAADALDVTLLEGMWEVRFLQRITSALLRSAGAQDNLDAPKLTRARDYATKLVEVHGEDALSWWLLADCQRLLRDTAAAAKSYEKLLTIGYDPEEGHEVLFDYGTCLLHLDRVAEADTVFDRQLGFTHNHPGALLGRATILAHYLAKGDGDLEDGLKEVREWCATAQAQLKGVADTQAIHYRAKALVLESACLALEGRPLADQETPLRDALQFHPWNVDALARLAEVLEARGQSEEAAQFRARADKALNM